MVSKKYIYLAIVVIIVLVLCYLAYKYYYSNSKDNNTIHKQNKNNDKNNLQLLNQRFYDYKKVYPELKIFKDNRNKILEEVNKINNDEWKDWPEKNLYTEDMSWKVFPFFGFGIWIDHNCNKCPEISKIIKNIPNLRTASLSKLDPGTKLTPHQGWASLSNNVLRCHYGIIVPDDCYIYVESETQQMLKNEIIVFDDSKTHSAGNFSNDERIVLILDIERPDFVEKGKSECKDTQELLSFVKSFKMMNQNQNKN
jgi:ornithine lipid ester-linked acyl 2-hydroxylase